MFQEVLEEVLERFWIPNKDVCMLRGGTCDSELGSYPGQGRQVSGVLVAAQGSLGLHLAICCR